MTSTIIDITSQIQQIKQNNCWQNPLEQKHFIKLQCQKPLEQLTQINQTLPNSNPQNTSNQQKSYQPLNFFQNTLDIPLIKCEESSSTCLIQNYVNNSNTDSKLIKQQTLNHNNNVMQLTQTKPQEKETYNIYNLQKDLYNIKQEYIQQNSTQNNTISNKIETLKRKPIFNDFQLSFNKKIIINQQQQQQQNIYNINYSNNCIQWMQQYLKNPKIIMLLMDDQQTQQCAQNMKYQNISLEKQISQNLIKINYNNMFQTINSNIQPKKQICMPLQQKLNQTPQKQIITEEKKYNKNGKLLQKKSKFHNKNKLFINRIIRFFHLETLENIQMPSKLKQVVFTFVDEARKTAREIVDGKVIKTDLFSHSHYKLLFLTLNDHTINIMSKNDKDCKLHKDILDIDLSEKIPQEKIEFINFLKNCVHEICVKNLKNKMMNNQDFESNDQEYERRAFFGMQQMINGNHVSRF